MIRVFLKLQRCENFFSNEIKVHFYSTTEEVSARFLRIEILNKKKPNQPQGWDGKPRVFEQAGDSLVADNIGGIERC
jgi:hypothetical protein